MSVQLKTVEGMQRKKLKASQGLYILTEWDPAGNAVEVSQRYMIHPMTLYRWEETINPLSVLTGFFLMAVLVFGSWQSSYATDDEITAILKQPFRIVLTAAIGSTGYSWSAQFDKALLKLKKSWYEKPESKLLGASGKQVFVFVPLKPGNTKIEMRLKRPWESSALKAKVYQISILPK